MKPIKIVRIIARLNIGGPAINAVLLTEGLNNNGFKTCLVAGKTEITEGDMSYLAEQKGVRPIFVPQLGRRLNLFRDLKALWKIYRIIKKEKPDILHTHTAKAGALGRLAGILYGISGFRFAPLRWAHLNNKVILVHTFHGHVFDGYFNNLATKIFVIIERILAGFTTKIIAVSNSVADDISIRYNIAQRDKITVMPLGFELERFFEVDKNRGKFRQELGLTNDVLLVGIVGRLVPIKNHKMFLDAVRKLSAISCQLLAKFIIVGDGELRQELKNYAAGLGIKDKVVFLGWRRDLENIYADLDVVCLTSLNEGTPVSLIEAMAAAKPVAATDVGGVKDVVQNGKSGILAASGDVEGFSKALLEMLADKEKRIEMGVNGRRFVAENFRKERLIKDTRSLYEELLTERER